MDRDLFRNRERELRTCAEIVGKLTQMPDRATQKMDAEMSSDTYEEVS
jgi:hypothetical protein